MCLPFASIGVFRGSSSKIPARSPALAPCLSCEQTTAECAVEDDPGRGRKKQGNYLDAQNEDRSQEETGFRFGFRSQQSSPIVVRPSAHPVSPCPSSRFFFPKASLRARQTNGGDGCGSPDRRGGGRGVGVPLLGLWPFCGPGRGQARACPIAFDLRLPHRPRGLALAWYPARMAPEKIVMSNGAR